VKAVRFSIPEAAVIGSAPLGIYQDGVCLIEKASNLRRYRVRRITKRVISSTQVGVGGSERVCAGLLIDTQYLIKV
jgi:hypothetical protein